MKILALSDIHGRFDKFDPSAMPEADLCVIAGDITNLGLHRTAEFARSQTWMEQIADRMPIFWIPGNHDLLMEADTYEPVGTRPGEHYVRCIQDRLQAIWMPRFTAW